MSESEIEDVEQGRKRSRKESAESQSTVRTKAKMQGKALVKGKTVRKSSEQSNAVLVGPKPNTISTQT